MAVEVKLEGFDQLQKLLREIVPAMRKKVIRNALAAGARIVRDEAKRNVPVLQNQFRAPYRSAGTVKKAIRVRSSKVARRAGDIGVFVNVKPAPPAQRGAKSRTDPYYWRFLEFGTKKMTKRPFLVPAVGKFPQALEEFKTQVGRWLEKLNATGKATP